MVSNNYFGGSSIKFNLDPHFPMTLSDKRIKEIDKETAIYREKDVKDFIRQLKEMLGDGIFEDDTLSIIFEIIDKLAGDKLV